MQRRQSHRAWSAHADAPVCASAVLPGRRAVWCTAGGAVPRVSKQTRRQVRERARASVCAAAGVPTQLLQRLEALQLTRCWRCRCCYRCCCRCCSCCMCARTAGTGGRRRRYHWTARRQGCRLAARFTSTAVAGTRCECGSCLRHQHCTFFFHGGLRCRVYISAVRCLGRFLHRCFCCPGCWTAAATMPAHRADHSKNKCCRMALHARVQTHNRGAAAPSHARAMAT